MWTWLGGSNLVSASGNYQSIGNAGFPGARYGSTSFTTSNGDFYLFGGYGFANTSTIGTSLFPFKN